MNLLYKQHLRKIPNFEVFMIKKERYIKAARAFEKKALNVMISFTKTKIKAVDKLIKKMLKNEPNKVFAIQCLKTTKENLDNILQNLELSMALAKAFINEFKTVVGLVEKFCKKKFDKFEKVMRAYFDFIMMFFTDFKLRVEGYSKGDTDLYGFTLVNQQNSNSFNVIVDFKM